MTVFCLKIPVGISPQLVVGESEHKAGRKMWSLEIEDSPVEGDVGSSSMQVVPAQSGMAIEAVHLVVWLTRQQADLDRVHVLGRHRFLTVGCRSA